MVPALPARPHRKHATPDRQLALRPCHWCPAKASLVVFWVFVGCVGAQSDNSTADFPLIYIPHTNTTVVDIGLGRRRRAPPTAWPTAAPTSAPTAAGLLEADCGAGVTERCCLARKAWSEAEALGSCGGGGDQGSSFEDGRCGLAAAVCTECDGMLDSGGLDAGTDVSSGSTSGGSQAKMSCAPARPPLRCSMMSADIGIVIVALTGVLLLVLTVSWTVLFDLRALPLLLQRGETKWSGCPSVPASSGSAPQPPPLPQTGAPWPAGEPPSGNSALSKLRSAAFQDARSPTWWTEEAASRTPEPQAASSAGAEFIFVGSRCSTATGSDGSGATASTADSTPPASQTSIAKLISSSPGQASSFPPGCSMVGMPQHGMVVGSCDASANRVYWPPRLARIWAYRSIFLCVSYLAVCLRSLHTIVCTMALLRPLLITAVELAVCVLPLVWCQWTSTPPPTPETALRAGISHGCYRNNLPRFLVFAMTMVAFEGYSTVSAASAVAGTSCDTPPWQPISLHCFGVVVAVLRVYSALLGLRLQEELASVSRRVIPMPQPLDLGEVGLDLDVEERGQIESAEKEIPVSMWRSDLMVDCAKPHSQTLGFDQMDCQASLPSRPPLPPLLRAVDNSWCEDPEISGQMSKRDAPGKWTKRLKKACSRRYVFRAALVLVILAAAASVLVFYSTGKRPDGKVLPSSCVTRQNATATCSQFESIGDGVWNPAKGQSVAGAADTIHDCCTACDEMDGCQAWMFESFTRRCRMIRFEEAPCIDDPGDLRCRCHTHAGTSFGFKPNSQIVWLNVD